MRRHLVLLAVPLVVLMAACGDDDMAEPAGTTAPATTSPAARPTPSSLVPASTPSTGGGEPISSAEEEAAIADLAQRQDVDPSQITVVSDEDVTWRSGAIGCPDPDMMYTQALVPGTRIILELDGTRYQYHSGGPRSIFLCEHPEPPVGE